MLRVQDDFEIPRVLAVASHDLNPLLSELEPLLAPQGLQLVTVPTARAAVQLAHVQRFAGFVLEAKMEPLSGFAAATLLLRNRANRRTPVLFLADDSTSIAGLNSASDGQLDALCKPCRAGELAKKLLEMMSAGKRVLRAS